jgi:hypothetical protein
MPGQALPYDGGGHGHSHGLVDESIKRSRDGVRAVALSPTILAVAAGPRSRSALPSCCARLGPSAGRVVATALVVALGLPVADPLIGLAITALILEITRDSWRTVRGERGHSH